MGTRHLPAVIGLTVGGLVLSVGLYVTADRTGDTLGGTGGAPGTAVGQPLEGVTGAEDDGRWRTPDILSRADGSSMTFEEYLDLLRAAGRLIGDDAYATYLSLIQQRFDPRGPALPSEPAPWPGWEVDNTGQDGWDSSSYPKDPPIAAPSGSVLEEIYDGPADGRGRYWRYATPAGLSIEDACAAAKDALVAYGTTLSSTEDPCSNLIAGTYTVRGSLPDGGGITVYNLESDTLCPDYTVGCNNWVTELNYER